MRNRIASETMTNIFSLSILLTLLSHHVIQGSVIVSSEETGDSVIIKGPDNRFPLASSTIVLDCQVNETADISLVTWSKTFLNSTELLYTYDGTEGKITESDHEDRNFVLEIENVTLSDVGTYECTVESNGQNYSERAGVSVYGSPNVRQSSSWVYEGDAYRFICSVEIAPFSDSFEHRAAVQPVITAWYRTRSTGPVYLQRVRSDFLGFDHFGEVVPVYEEEFQVLEVANFDDPHLLGCDISTVEHETLNASQWANILVRVRDVQATPTDDRFNVSDRLYCNGFGYPVPEYQWSRVEPSLIIHGKWLLLNNSDIGKQTWDCIGVQYVGSVISIDSDRKTFCVGSDDICDDDNGGARAGSGSIALLFAFAVLFLGV